MLNPAHRQFFALSKATSASNAPSNNEEPRTYLEGKSVYQTLCDYSMCSPHVRRLLRSLMAYSFSMKTNGGKKMAQQVRNRTDLDKRNNHKVAHGKGLMGAFRNIVGLDRLAGGYTFGILKTSVQDSQLDSGSTAVRDIEILLREASMLQ